VTVTEVVAHLVTRALEEQLTPEEAMAAAMARLKGAFALAIIFAGRHDLMIGARRGSPLVVGYGDGEMFLGSDALALAPLTQRICYLEEGDWAVVSNRQATIYDASGVTVNRRVVETALSGAMIGKGNYRHFMQKEIFEQPTVIGDTMHTMLNPAERTITLPPLPIDMARVPRVSISACGTAYYAGLVGKYWIERLARVPVEIDVASEFRYRNMPMVEGGLAIFISQSGETMDTLMAVKFASAAGAHTLSICNTQGATIARESDAVIYTHAGPEVAVASTKAFVAQVAALYLLGLHLASVRGSLSAQEITGLTAELQALPDQLATVLEQHDAIKQLAGWMTDTRSVLFLGRHAGYPVALEGALKLKELAYIHAEGFAAGELKHGPIALIEPGQPVFVIVPSPRATDSLHKKVVSNIQEIRARGARVLAIAEQGDVAVLPYADEVIVIPLASTLFEPLLAVAPLQIFAMELASAKGLDVDQPRNLAKSVTVE
jgi:glucosamine--fructose-6-phosphate aminotransferase (isomerizing)